MLGIVEENNENEFVTTISSDRYAELIDAETRLEILTAYIVNEVDELDKVILLRVLGYNKDANYIVKKRKEESENENIKN